MSESRFTLFKDETGQVRVMTSKDKIFRQMHALAIFRNTDPQTHDEIQELCNAANSENWAFLYDVISENVKRLPQYRVIFEQVIGKPASEATGDDIWNAGFNSKTNRGIRWGWDQDLTSHQLADTKANNKKFENISPTFRQMALKDGALKVKRKAAPSRFYSNTTDQEVSRKDLTDAGMTEFYSRIHKR